MGPACGLAADLAAAESVGAEGYVWVLVGGESLDKFKGMLQGRWAWGNIEDVVRFRAAFEVSAKTGSWVLDIDTWWLQALKASNCPSASRIRLGRPHPPAPSVRPSASSVGQAVGLLRRSSPLVIPAGLSLPGPHPSEPPPGRHCFRQRVPVNRGPGHKQVPRSRQRHSPTRLIPWGAIEYKTGLARTGQPYFIITLRVPTIGDAIV